MRQAEPLLPHNAREDVSHPYLPPFPLTAKGDRKTLGPLVNDEYVNMPLARFDDNSVQRLLPGANVRRFVMP